MVDQRMSSKSVSGDTQRAVLGGTPVQTFLLSGRVYLVVVKYKRFVNHFLQETSVCPERKFLEWFFFLITTETSFKSFDRV